APIPPLQGYRMRPFRYRDDDSSTGTTIASVLLGAVAGFAVGMYVAQRVGGFGGLTARLRRRAKGEDAGTSPELPADEFVESADDIEDEEEAEIGAASSETAADERSE